jgi:hypothetical protein
VKRKKYNLGPSMVTLKNLTARSHRKSNLRMCVHVCACVCVFANRRGKNRTGVTYAQALRTVCVWPHVVHGLLFNMQARVRPLRRHQITGFLVPNCEEYYLPRADPFHQLTAGKQGFLEKLIVIQLIKTFLPFRIAWFLDFIHLL